jgi:hypothetical protein
MLLMIFMALSLLHCRWPPRAVHFLFIRIAIAALATQCAIPLSTTQGAATKSRQGQAVVEVAF